MLDRRIFIEFFTELDLLISRHRRILAKDDLMAEELYILQEMLREAAGEQSAVPNEVTLSIVKKMDQITDNIREKAEEEQRIIAESPAAYDRNQEKTAAGYFLLLEDMDSFSNEYRQCVLHMISAAAC